jgi:hypothetical protein
MLHHTRGSQGPTPFKYNVGNAPTHSDYYYLPGTLYGMLPFHALPVIRCIYMHTKTEGYNDVLTYAIHAVHFLYIVIVYTG